MPQISFEHSPWWLVAAIAVAVVLVVWHYYTAKVFSKKQRLILGVLRFLVLLLVAILLLSPLVKSFTERTEKPLLIWLQDESASMVTQKDSSAVRKFINSEGPQLKAALAEKYDLKTFSFSGDLEADNGNFEGTETNIAQALQGVNGRYFGENIGATLLISDGIYNRGAQPDVIAQNLSFPVYTLATGDTSLRKDLRLKALIHNQQTYQGSAFPVNVQIEAQALAGKSFKLSIRGPEGLVHSETLRITSPNFYDASQIYLKAQKPGLQRYVVRLEALEGEENLDNNQGSFVIEVIDQRKKIVVLAHGPHPDVAALKAALAQKKVYEVSVLNARELDQIPKADLFIIHNPVEATLQKLPLNQVPFLLITSAESPYGYLRQNLNFDLKRRSGSEEVFAAYNPNFTLFQLTEAERDFLEDLPPLLAPYGSPELSGNPTPLLYKKIGSVNTKQPLLAFNNVNEIRSAFLLGLNTWRWRMFNYKKAGNFKSFDGFWQKTVQYLTTQNAKKRFSVEVAKRFSNDESIEMNARLLDPSLELTNTAPVDLTLTNKKGEKFQYTFQRSKKTYLLQIQSLPQGVYRYEARTTLGAEVFTESGEFVVEDIDFENRNTKANHGALRDIAQKSGGRFYLLSQQNQLKGSLIENQKAQIEIYREETLKSIFNYWWILALILALLTAEWALRKYWGNY